MVGLKVWEQDQSNIDDKLAVSYHSVYRARTAEREKVKFSNLFMQRLLLMESN